MPGPHILGLDFVAFSMISATVQQSWRTWSSLIAFRKSAAETLVSLVLISAIRSPGLATIGRAEYSEELARSSGRTRPSAQPPERIRSGQHFLIGNAGAVEWIRTTTLLRAPAPQAGASASSATTALMR